jgi:hypothetical protein
MITSLFHWREVFAKGISFIVGFKRFFGRQKSRAMIMDHDYMTFGTPLVSTLLP